jgi:hypothetical protein
VYAITRYIGINYENNNSLYYKYGNSIKLLKLALTTLILYSCQSKIQNQHSDQSDTACYAGYQSECSGTQGRTQNVSFLGRRYFKLPILSCPRIPPATQATINWSVSKFFHDVYVSKRYVMSVTTSRYCRGMYTFTSGFDMF